MTNKNWRIVWFHSSLQHSLKPLEHLILQNTQRYKVNGKKKYTIIPYTLVTGDGAI